MITNFQRIILALICLATLAMLLQCNSTSEFCTSCISPALRITTVTPSGDTLDPPEVFMVSPDSSHTWVDTSEYGRAKHAVSLYGNPGLYTLDLVYSDGTTFHLEKIKVNQSPKMTCEHPVSENILIEKSPVLQKSNSIQGFKIRSQQSGGGCG